MLYIKTKKRMQRVSLLFLVFGVLFANLYMVLLLNSTPDAVIKKNYGDEQVTLDIKEKIPLAADSSSIISREGDNMDLLLQQSLLNTTIQEFPNLDIENILSQPSPKDSSFNSSLINISIEDIKIKDKVVSYGDARDDEALLYNFYYSIGFQVRNNCTLDNFTLVFNELDLSGNSDADIFLEILNSKWDTVDGRVEPGIDQLKTPWMDVVENDSVKVEHFYDVDVFLNCSNTYKNYFFIRVGQITSNEHAQVELVTATDLSDKVVLYREQFGYLDEGLDPSLIIGLKPIVSYNPLPSQINLTINNENIEDISNGRGYWKSKLEFGSDLGQINFTMNADWWDVSLNITRVQINYTKKINVPARFGCAGNTQPIQWNVSIGEIDSFSSHPILNHEKINITIPKNWSNVEIWQGQNNRSSDIMSHSSSAFLTTYQLRNAYNGAFWYLNATSNNIMSDIRYIVDAEEKSVVVYGDVVRFYNNFTHPIYNARLNVSVYSPDPYGNQVKWSIDQAIPSPASSNLSSSILDTSTLDGISGDYRVQSCVYNGTYAGFREEILTISRKSAISTSSDDDDDDDDEGSNGDLLPYYLLISSLALGIGILVGIYLKVIKPRRSNIKQTVI